MKFFLVNCLLLISFSCFSQQALDTVFKKGKITGVQIVSTDNGKECFYVYGKIRSDETDAVNASTVFQAASLSKTVLAYITLKLVDRKLIALDTPLYQYYQYKRIGADEAAKKITARMVLHHQTGFANWAANPTGKGWSTSELKTQHTPGTYFTYSGEGFMYLQLCIEHLLKQSLEDIAVKEVFLPLQMTSSSFLWKPSFENTGTFGHNKNEEVTDRTEFFLPAGAYSLLTTATDFNRFLQALMNGEGLTKQTHQLMLNDTVSVRKNSLATKEATSHIFWGLGVGIEQNALGKAIWHWGDNGDFKCFFMAFPEQKKSIVYFTNSENGLKTAPVVLDYFFRKNTWWAFKWLDTEF